ncbi:MAG: alginate export family protein [Acidobacteriia bacterium]|nr:alginate export family protein [Terriglobia bacterium]
MYRFHVFAYCLLLSVYAGAASGQDKQNGGLPSWLQTGVELRGRMEGYTGLDYVSGREDLYYFHRIRAHALIKPLPWMKFMVMAQHSLAPGRRAPVPANAGGGLDLYQAYAEFAGTGESRWGAQIGRQEFTFTGERMIGRSNWNNTGRSFDAARFYHQNARTRIEWFASTQVTANQDSFNRFTTATQLHGMYITSKAVLPKSTVESYLVFKINPRELSETGRTGRTAHYTAGVHLEGKLPQRWDYIVETALQAGTLAREQHRAWMGSYTIGYTTGSDPAAPRLLAAYTRASGDGNYGDGKRGTFDQMYPTNHQYYGLADRVTTRNMQDVMAAVILKPAKQLSVRPEYHSVWLANRQDAYYDFGGRPVVRNPRATSSHLLRELDVMLTWETTRNLQILGVVGHIFPGGFLKQSTPGAGGNVFYLQWRYSL